MIERILPQLLTYLTGKRREKVEIQWASNNWTHNAFRLFELLFWRRAGIRFEGGSYSHHNKTYRTFGTFENLIAYGEHLVRSFELIPGFEIVRIPDFALPSGGTIPSPFRFAVAFDNAQFSSASGTVTLSCTVTGSNTYMFAGDSFSANASAVTATFNSVAMTTEGTLIWIGSTNPINGNSLIGPATGTHDYVTSSNSNGPVVNTYSGCAQSAFDEYQTHADTGTTATVTFTTATANCWGVMFTTGTNNTPAAGSGTTGRSMNAAGASIASSFDSNANMATGSVTLTATGYQAGHTGAVGYKFSQVVGTLYTQTYTETIVLTATLLKSTTRVLTQTFSLTDSILKSALRVLTQTVSMLDTVTTLKVISATISETVSLADSLIRSLIRVCSETMTNTATFIKSTGRTFTDTFTLTDTFARVLSRGAILLETITNTATYRFRLNGTNVIWTKVRKSASSVWTHISKSNQ